MSVEWLRLVDARTMSRKSVGVEVEEDLNVVARQRGSMTTVYEVVDVDLVAPKTCMIFWRLDVSWSCNSTGVDC